MVFVAQMFVSPYLKHTLSFYTQSVIPDVCKLSIKFELISGEGAVCIISPYSTLLTFASCLAYLEHIPIVSPLRMKTARRGRSKACCLYHV